MKKHAVVIALLLASSVAAAQELVPPGQYRFAEIFGLEDDTSEFRTSERNVFVYDLREDGTAERISGTWAMFRWSLEDYTLKIGDEWYIVADIVGPNMLAFDIPTTEFIGRNLGRAYLVTPVEE